MPVNIFFNDVRIPDFIILKDIKIQLLGDVDNILTPSNYGSKHKKIKFGNKVIKLELSTIFEKGHLIEKEDLNAIVKWIKGDDWKPSKLVLPEYEDEYYMAIVNNSGDVKNDIIEGIFTLEFLCLNPNRISEEEEKYVFPFYLRQKPPQRTRNSNESNYCLIHYEGLANTYPNIKFTVTSRCYEIKLAIKNSKYDNYIRFKGDFNEGETIEINLRTKKVLRNGEINMPILTLDSRFHELIEGKNLYELQSGNTLVEIKYRNEYI
ncbi:hypothetical protein GCM10008904_28940 [Paraclostridium ghonii]|uniref:Phage-related protein n=1 Tax=Paraclostridium ghonii TaxID=29358 RepID=A0ABU0N3S4_9FIRM|nr:phage tail domain-containing protein [Paeniclostridium ghonii]MDQ0557619.1 phage-related protein [Paeniclostridium ghonii]